MPSIKDLKIGTYVRYQNAIFRVLRKEIVAYGTHCHSKTKLFLQPLNSKGEKSFNFNHSDSLEELDIVRKAGQVISKGAKGIQIMDTLTYETIDAEIEPELLEQLKEGDIVTFIQVEGKTMVLEKR